MKKRVIKVKKGMKLFKMFQTSNWRDIKEVVVVKKDNDNVWIIRERKNQKYGVKRNRYGIQNSYHNTLEAAKKYLIKYINIEIENLNRKLNKAKSVIEKLNK